MEKRKDSKSFLIKENLYQGLFMNSLDAIFITAQDGSIFSANPAACRMLGRTEEEICRIGRVGVTENSQELTDALTQRSQSGKFFGELTFIRSDGTRFPVEISSSVFEDKQGNELTTIIAREITDRKKTEQALFDSEERLRLASKATGFGTYSYNFSSGAAYYSDEFLALYGLEPGEKLELDSDLVTKHIYPDDKPRFLELMTRANDPQGNGILDMEFRIIHKNGSIRWLKAKGLTVFSKMGIDGKPLHANGIVQDITDRKRVENELKEREEKYRLLSEQSGMGIALYSPDGLILFFNERSIRNLGGKAEDYIGKSLTSVFGKSYGLKFLRRIRKAIETGRTYDYEDFVETPSGKFWFLSNLTRICNPGGDIIGVQVLAHNITYRKKMEARLHESKKMLEKLNRHLREVRENERSQLALNLHDDLGQRLTALNMDISWIKSRIGIQPASVKMKLEEMSAAINETVDSIKELSSILRPAILYNLGIVPAIIYQLRNFENKFAIKSQFYFDSEDFNIDDAISLVLYRILQESLTNIVRHSGASETDVSLRKVKNSIELIILDNGRGFENDLIDSPDSMGLAGMRERVNSVNGTLSIIGGKGSGTSITVTIPYKIRKNA